MDEERPIPGIPVLDRQELPVRRDVHGRAVAPSRIPETRPTPLGDWFIYLSVGVLACGIVAITALEFGTPLAAPLVKLPVLVGGALLLVVTLDAIVRIWRSARAWLPVDRDRGRFRYVWVATLVAALITLLAVMAIVAAA